MNERVPLSFLLAQNKEEQPPVEPIVPFPAMFGEEPKIVTAVLDKTAILASTNDQYERVARRHDEIYVDPSAVEWRMKTATYEGARLNKDAKERQAKAGTNSPWRAEMAITYEKLEGSRIEQRAKSDERALKNQAEVAAKAELTSKAETAARKTLAEAGRHKEDEAAALEHALRKPTREEKAKEEFEGGVRRLLREADEQHPEAQKKKRTDPMKFCPGCRQHKPKSDFPLGKGFFKCNECRASGVLAQRSDFRDALQRNEQLAQKGMKHCPRCDRDVGVEAFNRNSSKGDGLQAICRQCQSDIYTIGSTGHRQLTAKGENDAHKIGAEVTPTSVVEVPPPMLHSASEEVEKPEPKEPKPRKNGRPALTFTELLGDLKQLGARCGDLELDNARLAKENEHLRAEQASLYDELHGIVAMAKQRKEVAR